MQCLTGSGTMTVRGCRETHNTNSRSEDSAMCILQALSSTCTYVGGDGAKGQAEREAKETETRTKTHVKQMEIPE